MRNSETLSPMPRAEIIEVLGRIRPNTTFLTVFDYTNNQFEVSNFSLAFHVTYSGVLERSVQKLKAYKTTDPIEDIGRLELISSYTQSLRNMAAGDYSNMHEHYDYFYDENKKLIKCVKMHRESGTIHINGYETHKTITKPIVYPVSKESARARAKRLLEQRLPIGKYRQFKLVPEKFKHIAVERLRILPPID